MKNEENNTEQLPENQETSKPGNLSRRLKFLLILSVLFLVISSAVLTGLASMIFSAHKPVPLKPLRQEELLLQQKLIHRLSHEMFRKRPGRTSRIVFRRSEMESLFRLVDFGLTTAKIAGKYKGMDLRNLEPDFGNGEITLHYPLVTKYKWLFGGVLRFKLTGTPIFADKHLQIKLRECRLGSIQLPRSLVQKSLDRFLTNLQNAKDFVQFSKVVQEIRINPDGSWHVSYSPAKLMPLLL